MAFTLALDLQVGDDGLILLLACHRAVIVSELQPHEPDPHYRLPQPLPVHTSFSPPLFHIVDDLAHCLPNEQDDLP